MKKKCGKSLTTALAISSLLFLSHIQVQAADQPKPKAIPGIPILLLSEEGPKPVPQPNIVFITSVTFTGGAFGNLEAADKQCQSLATAAGLPNNTYRAWLSSSFANAIERLGTARGWVRVDGKPFADTIKDIVAGKIFHPLMVDEKGHYYPGLGVWTGTFSDGTVDSDGHTCSDWTRPDAIGGVGYNDGVAGVFTAYGDSACSVPHHLYCFGINNNVPVKVKPVVGRIAFVTRSAWIPEGGLEVADSICQAEASSASLSGNFKALLPTVGMSAAKRFDSGSGYLPWVRPDGVAIAPTAAALFSADFLDTAINQTADGFLYFGDYGVWTGTLPNTAGTETTTCNNWRNSHDTESAGGGTAGFTSQAKSFGNSVSLCSATGMHLYCLQE